MADIWRYVAAAAAAYLLGSLNGSLLTSRLLLRDDIRKHGSGNAGATNVLRTYGPKWTLLVAVWDIGRGVLAMYLGSLLLPDVGAKGLRTAGGLMAGFFVILGHVFPLFFGFKGGRGIITALAVFLVLDWKAALIALGLFIVIVALTRYVSLGSVIAVTSLPVLAILFGREWFTAAMYGAIAALIVFLHRDNIRRLLNGTENKFTGRKQ